MDRLSKLRAENERLNERCNRLSLEVEYGARALKTILKNTNCPETATFILEGLDRWPAHEQVTEMVFNNQDKSHQWKR